ncbi:MAG: hypothetical protein QF357_07505, partial [Dehalococcoidia bacterium]|nr:hypothetical protein [Dehalococcoidia bacterium]
SLWLVAYVLDSRSELELAAMGAATGEARREYLSEETISEIAYDADLITRTVAVRAEKSSDWDAVLPFLRLVVPGANFTVFGGGRESDATEFAVELSTLCDRVRQAAPVMFQLEIAAGAIDRPLTCRVAGLVEVLGAGDWRRYVAMAREMFGSVGMLKAALARADQQWFAVEYAGDIERTIYYLDQVEFGRVDHSLALEHRALRARFDLKALVENPNAWWALCDEFERWRKEYRRAYLQDHAQRRERDLVLRERIDRTTVRVCQIELLDRVEVLRGWPEPGLQDDLHVEPEAVHSDGLFADIPGAWDRVAGPFRVCESDGSGIPLINEPVCPGCRGRLGQAVSHTDVLELIAEVDRVFDAYRDRLGSVVSDLVLSSEDSDRLQKLFRLNSAGDLSDLANVLDDKVISFLNELFGDVSGNLDDWTLPPS